MLGPVHSSCSYHAACTTGHKLRASAVFFSTPLLTSVWTACARLCALTVSMPTTLRLHRRRALGHHTATRWQPDRATTSSKVQTISARVCVAPHNREGVRSAPLDTTTTARQGTVPICTPTSQRDATACQLTTAGQGTVPICTPTSFTQHTQQCASHVRLFAAIRREAGRQGSPRGASTSTPTTESAAVGLTHRPLFNTGESAAEALPQCFGAGMPILRPPGFIACSPSDAVGRGAPTYSTLSFSTSRALHSARRFTGESPSDRGVYAGIGSVFELAVRRPSTTRVLEGGVLIRATVVFFSTLCAGAGTGSAPTA